MSGRNANPKVFIESEMTYIATHMKFDLLTALMKASCTRG